MFFMKTFLHNTTPGPKRGTGWACANVSLPVKILEIFQLQTKNEKSEDYCKADHNSVYSSILQVYRCHWIYDRGYNILLVENVAIKTILAD